jgi:hypothetical protein
MPGAFGQVSGVSGSLNQSAATQTPTDAPASTLRGVVVNAVTDQPIPRALVQIAGHSLLTEHDGKFEFTGLTETTATIRATKPGFYEGPEPFANSRSVTLNNSGEEIQIRLYPEALLTGTVSAPNGDPLPQVSVQALRRMDDAFGSRWMVSAQTNTDSDGQFRLPLPGGDYIVETQYQAERPGVHEAILPMLLPAAGSSGGQQAATSTMHLASGTEQHLDLRPQLRASHAVHIRIDGDQGRPQIEVHMTNGLTFMTGTRPSESPGEVVASLPSGTYTLSAMSANGDLTTYGETRVTVGDHDVTGVELHMTRVAPLTAELTVDPVAASDNPPPTVQQLGIFFSRTNSSASPMNQNMFLQQGRNSPAGVTLLPGTYRLRAQGSGQWFIEAATLGGTDLLAQDLVVDSASSSVPLHLVVNNQTATLKSTVKLNGQPAACWVYLVATTPSATPVINAMSAADGTLTREYLPPGSYRVLAFETRQSINLTDPAIAQEYAPYVKSVTVAAGETGNLDLDAVPAAEVK